MAVAIAVIYWVLEAGMHAYVWHNGSFFDTLLGEHDPNELWMRFVITALLLGFGVHMQRVRVRENRARIRAERLNRLLRFLSDINQHVQRGVKEQDMFDAACRAAVESGGYRFAWVGKANDDGMTLSAWAAEPGCRLESDIEALRRRGGLLHCAGVQDVFSSGQCRLCELQERMECDAPWRDAFISRGCRFAAALPIRIGVRPIGVFEIYICEDGQFSEGELAILNEIADDISVALMNAEHEQQSKANEEALKQRLEELERFHKSTVQREFRIKELRDEVDSLKVMLGAKNTESEA